MTRARSQTGRGQQLLPGEERRRSQRVMIRVPVTLHLTIAGQAVTIHAHTVAVNDHGAMLLCSRTVDADVRLELQHDRTRQGLACRVSRTPRDTPEGFLIPVEFAAPAPGFWQISFFGYEFPVDSYVLAVQFPRSEGGGLPEIRQLKTDH